MEDLKIASSEKCPLCGGDIILGECSFCGYAVPDTGKLSAVYDLSPDNVVFGFEAEDDDMIPTIESPDADALPTAKQVRDAARLKRKVAAKETAAANGKIAASSANTANTEFVPYTKPVYAQPKQPEPSA
ncbi:MAG: hypothetical protein K2G04_01055, partial [Oscillospiraceae bacterium]|nr:hypothetical protein [Oscillospiraceae bacterium]